MQGQDRSRPLARQYLVLDNQYEARGEGSDELMASLRDLLSRVTQISGVRAAVLAGREGLPLEGAGRGDTRLFETLAALGASALQTAEALGAEMPVGATLGTMLEYERALVRVDPLGEYAAVVTLIENAAAVARVRQTLLASRDEILRALDGM